MRQGPLFTHQENERASELWFCQFPTTNKDGIEHQASFSFTPDQIGQRLPHQVAMRQSQYEAHWIEQFAQVRDGVGDRDRAADLDYIVVRFLSNPDPQTCQKVAAVVQQTDMYKGEWALDLQMALHFVGGQSTVVHGGNVVRDEIHLLVSDFGPEFG